MRLSHNFGRPCTVPRHCTCVKSRNLAVGAGRQFVCRADMRVVAIPGALRAGSTNNGLLRAAAQVLPSGMHMVQADYSQLPLYNDDLWTTGIPDSVKIFRDHIQSADALLFAVPEYNYSLPGPLKNAIDWASKNPNVFAGKPATMLGQCCCCSLKQQHVHAVPHNPPQCLCICIAVSSMVSGHQLHTMLSWKHCLALTLCKAAHNSLVHHLFTLHTAPAAYTISCMHAS